MWEIDLIVTPRRLARRARVPASPFACEPLSTVVTFLFGLSVGTVTDGDQTGYYIGVQETSIFPFSLSFDSP
jgi:hypothetical protein